MEAELSSNGSKPAAPSKPVAILFDLDGTLRTNQPSSNEFFLDRASQLSGLLLDAEQRRAVVRWTHYYWAQSVELLQDVAAFPGREDDFWVHYAYRCLQAMGCSDRQAGMLARTMQDCMAQEYQAVNYVPPDVPETLAALKARGMRLAVLSNRTQPCHSELTQLGLLKYFELAMVAAEFSAWKPDPLIFQRALERLDIPADKAYYVGDNYYADIVGAQRAGLHPILLDPDGIFPEADCLVIRAIGDLPKVI